MPFPVVLAIDEDPDALGVLEAQLVQRYAHDYRVMCLGDSCVALQKLTELARAGDDVALVLAGMSRPADTRNCLLERVRGLHPHAKRALLVPLNVWADEPSAETVRALVASGDVDYYVVRPAASRDEVFHEAVSGFLLEWATERRIVPHTVHVVGEAWSGRAYELREVFGRCAVPHAFCLADSDEGQGFLAKVAGGGGNGHLQQLVLRDSGTGEQETVTADALFVLIGAHPHTGWLPPQIARDDKGFLLTGEEFADGCGWPLGRRPYPLETSMPGVLAAGDVRRSSVKRVASAVGEGSIAIQLVQALLASEQLAAGQPR